MMKKVYLIPLLVIFFGLTKIYSQFKYKIRYKVTVNEYNGEAGGNFGQTFGNHSIFGTGIFNEGVYTDDYIYESISEVTSYKSPSLKEPTEQDDGCSSNYNGNYNGLVNGKLNEEWDCASNASGKFFVNLIRPLAERNPNLTQIKRCEATPINVSISDMTYSLTYFNTNTEQFEFLLPYAVNPSNPEINPSEIPNINIEDYNNLQIQVRYTDDPNDVANFSDVLILDLIKCAPKLDVAIIPNPLTIQPTCFGDENGGVTAVFDRTLNEGEWMQLIFEQGGDPIQNSGLLYNSDFEDKSVTFIGNTLPAGNYNMIWQVGIDNDVIPGGSVPITILEPQSITFNLNKTDPTCTATSDGEITVDNLSGGNGGYSFDWKRNSESFDLPEGSTNIHLVNLPDGNYSLLVTDVLGCESEVQEVELVALAESPQLDSYLIFQPGEPPSCLATGSIVLEQVSGGDGNYAYNWTKDGEVFLPNNPTNLQDLEPGDYGLIVIDGGGQGCPSEEYGFTINELDPLEVSIAESVSITCKGDMGILEANPIGGTNCGYEYIWSTGETTKSIEVVQGSYFVSVTDNADNMEITFYEFEYTNPLLTVEAIQNNSSCKGEDFGSIQLDISGGTGGPYEVSWLDSPVTDSFRENLSIGEYIYFVSDGECQVSNEDSPIVLTEPETGIEVIEISKTNISVNGADDGMLTIDVQNGVPPFSYEWTKDEDLFVISQESTDNQLVGLGEGSYQVVVIDANGCSASLEQPVIIFEPEPLEIVEFIPENIYCKGEASGSITANVTGIPPFSYIWEKEGQVNFLVPNTSTITGLTPGTYTLRLTDDSNVSEVVSSVVLTEPSEVLGGNLVPFPTECFIGEEGTINVNAHGGTPPYVYSIDGGLNFQGSDTFTNLQADNYQVLIVDDNGCELFIDTTVGSPDQIKAEFAMTSQAFMDENIIAVDLSYPFPDTVEWSVPESAIITEQNNDKLGLMFTAPGEYEIGVTVYRDNCWSSLTKKILVLENSLTDTASENEGISREGIKRFIVYPNPTTGQFYVDVGLLEIANASIKVFGFANNNLILQELVGGKQDYSVAMNIEGLPSGIYVVVLETSMGNSLRKLIMR
ncbi:T9SS type A sorting domain-containing protein [Flagellimonas sp. S174]|uniref:T9SS type A sorting domain-containing protein n=1 Tax=Flagellimonas sp. S174 TaxID=3410790 RepID=UPI003BF4C2F8